MQSSDKQAEYAARMHRVLAHIDQHLDQTLELATLAQVAHFSPFHFHRIFSAWMGETFGDYLRRRRLELAALRLVSQPRVPVLSIALAVGFGSAEAFARAFRSRFGCSATAWRQAQVQWRAQQLSNPGQVFSKQDQAGDARDDDDQTSHHVTAEVFMNVKIIQRQPTTVAYLRHLGAYGAPIGEFWQHTVAPWMATNDLFGRPRYGISHDDPAITRAEQCRYDAGVEVPTDFQAPGNAQMTTLPGGRYAVTRFHGTAEEISETWTALLRDWLPASGMQLDARPFFEYYPIDARFDPDTGAFECDLCIPVIAL